MAVAHRDWEPGAPFQVDHPREYGVSAVTDDADQVTAAQVIELRVSTPARGVRVLHVAGEIDMLTAPVLDSMVARQLVSLPRLLVLDLSEVTFLSSSGLASLMAARDNAIEIGARLRLVCTGPMVLRPMEMTGLIDLFDIHHSLQVAQAD
jgi:anti-sigma B factor antagonist